MNQEEEIDKLFNDFIKKEEDKIPKNKSISNIVNKFKHVQASTNLQKNIHNLPPKSTSVKTVNRNIKKKLDYEQNEQEVISGVKYFYSDPKDFEDYNLPIEKRSWEGGSDAFNDALKYDPYMMRDYVYKYYKKYFEDKGLKSPFIKYSSENNLKGPENEPKFTLQPHQKFASSFMSNLTDFNGLLLNHGLGSGKTATAIAISAANQGFYSSLKHTSKEEIRNDLNVPRFKSNKPCEITILVPPQIKSQVIESLRGSIKNGELLSFNGACVLCFSDYQYYEHDKKIYETDNDSGVPEYYYYRLAFADSIEGDKLKSNLLGTLKQQQDSLHSYKISLDELLIENEYDDNDEETRRNNIERLKKQISSTENNIKTLMESLEKKISHIFKIISHTTFLNSISFLKGKQIITSDKKNNAKQQDIGKYIPTDYVLGYGKPKKDLPDSECLRSNKSILIIDEIHKMIAETGSSYQRLSNLLNVYCRNPYTGKPATKLIVLTATPIFDNAHESSLLINLLRPRIPFPYDRATFEKLFIDNTNKIPVLKNKILYQYLNSGYISYSKGSDPRDYPTRRNIYRCHVMQNKQLEIYKDAIIYDITKEIKNKNINEIMTTFFGEMNGKENNTGYIKSMKVCNIGIPIHDNKNIYDSVDVLINNFDEDNILEDLKEYSSKFY